MLNNTPSTQTHQHNETLDDIQVQKSPYSPPTLSILETNEISGGIEHFQEADGTGFFS